MKIIKQPSLLVKEYRGKFIGLIFAIIFPIACTILIVCAYVFWIKDDLLKDSFLNSFLFAIFLPYAYIFEIYEYFRYPKIKRLLRKNKSHQLAEIARSFNDRYALMAICALIDLESDELVGVLCEKLINPAKREQFRKKIQSYPYNWHIGNPILKTLNEEIKSHKITFLDSSGRADSRGRSLIIASVIITPLSLYMIGMGIYLVVDLSIGWLALAISGFALAIALISLFLLLPQPVYHKRIVKLFDQKNEERLEKIANRTNKRGLIALYGLFDLKSISFHPLLEEYSIKYRKKSKIKDIIKILDELDEEFRIKNATLRVMNTPKRN